MYRVVNYSDKVFVLEILDAWRVDVLMGIIIGEERKRRRCASYVYSVADYFPIPRFSCRHPCDRPMMSYEAGRNQTPE
jgi:hypothetical protein